MKPVARFLPYLFSFIAALSLSCDTQPSTAPRPELALDKSAKSGNSGCQSKGGQGRKPNTPVALTCVISIPGNPVASSDISWVDRASGRYFFADRSNSGVDIIDAENAVWVGRVGGMVGGFPTTPGTAGGTATSNGAGPNGVVVTPDQNLWAGDGNSTVRVADVDPGSPNYLKIIGSVSTALPGCDGGTATTHYCGRADEIGYDPEDHIILIANPTPLSVAAPHVVIASGPYATFISAAPPYNVLGHISFTGAGGLEQPLWNPENHRLYLTVPGKTGVTPASVAVINPTTMMVETSYPLDCLALTGVAGVGTTGIALGASQHLLVSACGFPIILHAQTGALISVIRQVGGGDEVWYNRGDRRFYVTGVDPAATPPAQALGVINAETATWLQNVPIVRGKNPASFAKNNHTFAIVQITAAIAAGTARDSTPCADFGLTRTGCVAVFTHTGEADDDKDDKEQ